MKILHVEGGRNLYGGALQVLYLIKGLQRHGVENLLACRSGSDLAKAAASYADVHAMSMKGDLDVSLIPKLYRLIRQTRPDLIHLQSRIGADIHGGIAGRLAGIPVVHSRRQDNPESRLMVSLKYRLHNRVIAISEGIARVLISEGLSPSKVRCVRSAVDGGPFEVMPDRERLCAEWNLPSGSRVVGTVAQLIKRKGHRYLLEAMPGLIEEFPDLHVIFFGQGSEESHLRELASQLGLMDRIRFAGFRDDLPLFLSSLDLLVHPALMEGLGVSLLQAAAAGVPVVACNVGGIPEAVRDGINGTLVAPGNSEMLEKAIGDLLRQPELARQMGISGRDLVKREFSVDTMVNGNFRVYQELLPDCKMNSAT